MKNIPEHITKTVAIDLVSGNEQILKTKINSYCHFFDRFSCGEYEIGLRLDWKDSSEDKDPMLDADFFEPGSTKPIKKLRKITPHHTEKKEDLPSGKRMYNFEYDSVKLKLIIQTTSQQHITGKAFIIKADNSY